MNATIVATLVDGGILIVGEVYAALLGYRVIGKRVGESPTYDRWSTGPNWIALGMWNLSSSMPCPSGVRNIARVARTSSSPIRKD